MQACIADRREGLECAVTGFLRPVKPTQHQCRLTMHHLLCFCTGSPSGLPVRGLWGLRQRLYCELT